MGKVVILNVNGIDKNASEINYEDLRWLYLDFYHKNNRFPTGHDCVAKNNLPQGRIVKRILEDNSISYNEFMNSMGKVGHTRASIQFYDQYVERYKNISLERNKYITSPELVNNKFGLPSAKWFVKNCPDESVNDFRDFVIWCGFDPFVVEKEYVEKKLIELQSKIDHPITRRDIETCDLGFTMIVIKRFWGCLSKCKDELRLKPTDHSLIQKKPFSYYKDKLDKVLDNHPRQYITWREIETSPINKYFDKPIAHKSMIKAFQDEGLDVHVYMKERGFKPSTKTFGYNYIYDDGERVTSSMEYKLSDYLRNELHMIFNVDYHRNVEYRKFTNWDSSSHMNCDYEIQIDDNKYYIEIFGILNNKNHDWQTYQHKSGKIKIYQEKSLLKKEVFDNNEIKYLFLFSDDFDENENYKEKLLTFLGLTMGG